MLSDDNKGNVTLFIRKKHFMQANWGHSRGRKHFSVQIVRCGDYFSSSSTMYYLSKIEGIYLPVFQKRKAKGWSLEEKHLDSSDILNILPWWMPFFVINYFLKKHHTTKHQKLIFFCEILNVRWLYTKINTCLPMHHMLQI